MRNMMLQVKNFKVLALCSLFLVALTGCKDKSDPFVDSGNTPDPKWVVTADNNMTLSMTAIIKVSFTSKEGTLGAFIGNDCCGIAEYNAEYDTYWLYISPSAEAGGDVQLRFFSPDLKRIFSASSTLMVTTDILLSPFAVYRLIALYHYTLTVLICQYENTHSSLLKGIFF